MLVPAALIHCFRRFNSGADREWEILPSTDALLSGNHDPGNHAESDL
jgi:hypothetical protein